MSRKRIHIRVPVLGEATLSDGEGGISKARIIDISAGGVRIEAPATPLADREYTVEVASYGRGTISFTARLVHANEQIAGFRIVAITGQDLRTIFHLVADFQATEEFIRHIDQGNILRDWFIDDRGNHLDITFEAAD